MFDSKKRLTKKIKSDSQDFESHLSRYVELVTHDSKRARATIREMQYQTNPFLLQCIAQTYFDESLFHEDGRQRTYFLKSKLRLAEKYIQKAYALAPNCIDVLWTLGKIYKAYNREAKAIRCFKKIISLGSDGIKETDSCTDISVVDSKINDSKFQLYRLYFEKNKKLSSEYLQSYKLGLKKLTPTLYAPLEKYLL